jgi:serine/threonine protein kinase
VGGKLVHFDGPLTFTADDLLCATAEIMGKSMYGTVYKATLEDGSLVAVKRLREKITKGHKEFEAETAALGKVRHQNLLSLSQSLLPRPQEGEAARLRLHAQGQPLRLFARSDCFELFPPLKLNSTL